MTRNQIDYWSNQENARHNVAVEQETQANNLRTYAELVRHNQEMERLTGEQNEINRWHLGNQDVENARHNLQNEILTRYGTDKNYILGMANLGELERHNLISEQIGQTDARTRAWEAGTNRMNAQTRSYESETARYGTIVNGAVGATNATTGRINAQTNIYNSRTQRGDAIARNAINGYSTVVGNSGKRNRDAANAVGKLIP